MRNEELAAVTDELERYGVEYHVGEEGKHLKITWDGPQGVTRTVVVARTGSDYRGPLNSRATVRRILRLDNVPLPQRPVVSLQKALSLPKPHDNGPARLAKLEQDFAALLDLLGDIQEEKRVMAKALLFLRSKLDNLKVTVSFGAEEEATEVVSTLKPPVAPVAAPLPVSVPTPTGSLKKKRVNRVKRGSNNRALMFLRTSVGWQHRDVIMKHLGYSNDLPSRKSIDVMLWRLRKEGFVEKGSGPYYRFKPQEAQVS